MIIQKRSLKYRALRATASRSSYECFQQAAAGAPRVCAHDAGKVLMCAQGCKSSYKVSINIRTLTGMKMVIKIEPSATVETLKWAIRDEEGSLADQQRLIFRGMQLQDDRTLSSYGIENDSTLFLVLQLRGQGDMLGNHSRDLTPAPGAKDVPITTPISVKIDDDVLGLTPATAAHLFKITEGGTGATIVGTSTLIPASRTVVFTPAAPLKPATWYYVTCGISGLKSGAGRELGLPPSHPIPLAKFEWHFETSHPSPVRLTIKHLQQAPQVVMYQPGKHPKRAFMRLICELFHLPEDDLLHIQLSTTAGGVSDPVLEEDGDFLALRDGDTVRITTGPGDHATI